MKYLFLCLFISYVAAETPKLEAYNIDLDAGITISGLSAGGFMAVQMHVAYSDLFTGVGVIAGGPYDCADGSLTTATTTCMLNLPFPINVNNLISRTNSYASVGKIADVSNMYNDRVYIFSGTKDLTVYPSVVEKVEKYYEAFVASDNIATQYNLAAVHGFPTDKYGSDCGKTNYVSYINNCAYDAASIMLHHFYGDMKRPIQPEEVATSGSFHTFDQNDFPNQRAWGYTGLGDEGYLYVPAACEDRSIPCRLHVSLHGCKQSSEEIGDTYVTETGYAEAAAANNIIILFPQTKSDLLNNPNGCFDWWGYADADYATRDGYQMQAIHNMVQRLLGEN